MSDPSTSPSRERRRKRSLLMLALQTVTVALVGGLLGLLVYRLVVSGHGAAVVAAVRAGKKPRAPRFDLKVIWRHAETWPPRYAGAAEGAHLSTRDLKGLPAVVNFWASWCLPCKSEAPRLVAAASANRGKVLVLGVDVEDFTSDARSFLRRYKINYPSVRDGSSSTYDGYGLTGLPETYYLDKRGRLLGHTLGEASVAELRRQIAKIEARG